MPLMVKLSVAVVMPPWICRAAPPETVVPAAVVPKVLEICMFKAPG